jgi:hypothetical protein
VSGVLTRPGKRRKGEGKERVRDAVAPILKRPVAGREQRGGGPVRGTTWQGGGGVAWGASTAVGRQRPEAGGHERCGWSGAPAADRWAPLTALGGAGRESGC